MFSDISTFLLFASCLIILSASMLLSFKTRFIQVRMIPQMFRLFVGLIFRNHSTSQNPNTVAAHKALFTAMSTTIGISTIVSPVIAIKLGGPGAVLGFLIATFFGAAVNFTEVTFALSYRKQLKDGTILGGPMQYLQKEISPFLAKWYALFCCILMTAWSAAQANQLAQVLDSPLLGGFRISSLFTGVALALLTIVILLGGIKRVSNLSTKLVPLMFLIYVGASFWIISFNLEKIPAIFQMIFHSAFTPQAFGSGVVVGGLVSALRWGVFKGLHSSEAGVGTQTIPHSMAETRAPVDQGVLAMLSTFTAGFLCLLSSVVTLMTATWLDPTLSLGIHMVLKSFELYFSYFGVCIVTISAFLFAFGTIVGNGFNGSQCFSYLSQRRFLSIYYIGTAALIFMGSILDVTLVWSVVDYIILPVVVPHILSIVYLSYKRGDLLNIQLGTKIAAKLETQPAHEP